MYFCDVRCYFSFFISNFIDLSLLFFLISLSKGLSILLIFSKNQLFISLIFSMVFFVSISLISALIFDFFASTYFRSCLFFLSSCFRCNIYFVSLKISYFLSFFFWSFCSFLGLLPWHMEVPRLGGLIRAVAAGLCHSHRNAGSELPLQPTPQLTAMPRS